MIALAAFMFAAQATAANTTRAEEHAKALAESGFLLTSRMKDSVVQDPSLRAEWRRVGFDKGCQAFVEVGDEVAARQVPKLVDPTVAAIHKFVPAERLERSPPSFVFGGLQMYRNRVADELERTSAPTIAAAIEDMRVSFRKRVAALPTTTNPADNIIAPRADIAAALGLGKAWDLDKPSQLQMACIELRIMVDQRPKITVGNH